MLQGGQDVRCYVYRAVDRQIDGQKGVVWCKVVRKEGEEC